MPVVEICVRKPTSAIRKSSTQQCPTSPELTGKTIEKSPGSSFSETNTIEEEVQRIITLPPKQGIVDKKRDKQSEGKAMESARAILNAQRSEVVMRDEEELEAIENARVIVDAQNSLHGTNTSVGRPRILAKTGNGVAFIVPIGKGEVGVSPPKLPRRLQKLCSAHSSIEELKSQFKYAENSEVKEQALCSKSLRLLKHSDWISKEVAKKLAIKQSEADRSLGPAQQNSDPEVKCSRKAIAIEDAQRFEKDHENVVLTATEEKTEESAVDSHSHQDNLPKKVE